MYAISKSVILTLPGSAQQLAAHVEKKQGWVSFITTSDPKHCTVYTSMRNVISKSAALFCDTLTLSPLLSMQPSLKRRSLVTRAERVPLAAEAESNRSKLEP